MGGFIYRDMGCSGASIEGGPPVPGTVLEGNVVLARSVGFDCSQFIINYLLRMAKGLQMQKMAWVVEDFYNCAGGAECDLNKF